MVVISRRVYPALSLASLAILLCVASTAADEIKLKDGTKIIGTIVGFEDSSFKVKTSYGFALVQKDQVDSITVVDDSKKMDPAVTKIPVAPTVPAEPATPPLPPAAKPSSSGAKSALGPAASAKHSKSDLAALPASADRKNSGSPVTANATRSASAPVAPAGETKSAENATSPTNAPLPERAATPKATNDTASNTAANETRSAAAKETATSAAKNVVHSEANVAGSAAAKGAANSAATSASGQPVAKPAAPEPMREHVSGNTYTNDTYGFQMYKPPDWKLIEGARAILPGTITALGTDEQTTYLLIGQDASGNSLAGEMDVADRRLRDVMDNFRPLGERHVSISGSSAIERRFRGSVDGRDWSGVAVYIPRDAHVFTIFGMTLADTDLVQIQENVISRAIHSLQFTKP